ncbi:MAG: hypothetical protein ACRDTG_11730 [Pseudonocardiaceae bacterium]
MGWDLFYAGSFEEGMARVTAALTLARPSRLICAVAACMRDFGQVVSTLSASTGWRSGSLVTVW